MQLKIHSDASYLSEPKAKAKSRIGGLFLFGQKNKLPHETPIQWPTVVPHTSPQTYGIIRC
jgi:hypothetical protein